MFNLFNKSKEQATEVAIPIKNSDSKEIKKNWKNLSKEKRITKQDIATLCLYRSLFIPDTSDKTRELLAYGTDKNGAIQRLKKSFQPITNSVRLNNGEHPYRSLLQALSMVRYSTMFDWLTENEQVKLLALSNLIKGEIE